jgi:hypothetical protein
LETLNNVKTHAHHKPFYKSTFHHIRFQYNKPCQDINMHESHLSEINHSFIFFWILIANISNCVSTDIDRKILCNTRHKFLKLSLIINNWNLLAWFIFKLFSENWISCCYWNCLTIYFWKRCWNKLSYKHHGCITNKRISKSF